MVRNGKINILEWRLFRDRLLLIQGGKILFTIFDVCFMLFKTSTSFAATHTDTLKLFYDVNKYELSAKHKYDIDSVLNFMDKHRTLIIKGFADNLDNKSFNKKLSIERAQSVNDYLFSRDSSLSLHSSGAGQIVSLDDSKTNGNPQNRRVDIIFEKINSRKSATQTRGVSKRSLDSVRFKQKTDSLSIMEVGGRLSVEELIFRPGRHILDSASAMYLKILSGYLTVHKGLTFEIRGHVCCTSQKDGFDVDALNHRLSENRAKEIFFYFLKNGVDPKRMTVTGVGSLEPKAVPEVTEEDKRMNRRVEIIILKK